MLDASVRLVHEGCSVHAVVDALRRVQSASRALLDAAAVHIDELAPPEAGSASCAVDTQRAGDDSEQDEFGWFDMLDVDGSGNVDVSSSLEATNRAAPCQRRRHEPPHSQQDDGTGATYGAGPCARSAVAGKSSSGATCGGVGATGSPGDFSAPYTATDPAEERQPRQADGQGWQEELGMGLAHGNRYAMRLSLAALDLVLHARSARPPSPHSTPSTERPSRTRDRPARSRGDGAGAGGEFIETILAPGISGEASVVVPGVVSGGDLVGLGLGFGLRTLRFGDGRVGG